MEEYVEKGVAKTKGDAAKAKHKKNMVKAKRIIADSIKDHLIPQIPLNCMKVRISTRR